MPSKSAPAGQFSAAVDYATEFLEKCYEKFGSSPTASFSAYCTEMAIINLPGLGNNYCDILARRDLMFYRYAPAVLEKIIRELREDMFVTKGEATRKNNEPKLLEHLKVGLIAGKHASSCKESFKAEIYDLSAKFLSNEYRSPRTGRVRSDGAYFILAYLVRCIECDFKLPCGLTKKDYAGSAQEVVYLAHRDVEQKTETTILLKDHDPELQRAVRRIMTSVALARRLAIQDLAYSASFFEKDPGFNLMWYCYVLHMIGDLRKI
jgi:hypothetical protein